MTRKAEAVAEGGFSLVTVKSNHTGLKGVDGKFQDHVITFYPDGENTFGALIGIEVDTRTGLVPFEIVAHTEAGDMPKTEQIMVKEGTFPSETLKVPPRKVAPLAADLPKIRRDQVLMKKTYAHSVSKRYWDPPLVMPVDNIITSIFGSKRVFNGIKQSAHYGTDLRAAIGTPVKAPVAGRVAVARNLFFTGWTVILDHGYGFFTIYGHMSKIKAKEGTDVTKGQLLGLSGMTGRASGPHLHWGVNLHGVKIDPMALVSGLK